MENRVLIDLALKYGLDDGQISKLVDCAYQVGVTELESEEFGKIAHFVCGKGFVDLAMEELVEAVRRELGS